MDFREASDVLTKSCPRLADVARVAGVSPGLIRQARLDPSTRSYRSPPDGWEAAIAKLARQRVQELERLAKELEE